MTAPAHIPAPASPEVVPRGLRRPAVAFAAVVLQVAPSVPRLRVFALRELLVVASGVLITFWFATNFHGATGALRLMLGVAAVGAAMNFAVMLPNGGMPVSRSAMRALGGHESAVTDGNLYKHRLAGDGTVLAPLGDVIPVRPLHLAASAGDFVLLLGAIGTVVVLAVPRRRPLPSGA